MSLVVVKFGGTSVASVECMRTAVGKILSLQKEYENIVVVVSAMAGETNRLLDLVNSFNAQHGAAHDTVLSAGEQVSAGLMVLALKEQGADAQSFQGWQVPIITSTDFEKARVESVEVERLQACMADGKIAVVPGFQGVTQEAQITTFGRGGSDITAVLLAAALKAEACYLFKDVDGVLSADPGIVPDPKILDKLGIEEMFELASQGAKVIHPRAIEAALRHQVDLKVLPTFKDTTQGTHIIAGDLESHSITGIVCNENEVRIRLQQMPVSPKGRAKLFGALAQALVEVDMIIHAGGVDGALTGDLTFTIPQADLEKALEIINQLKKSLKFSSLEILERMAKISVVGAGLRGHASVAQTVYDCLTDLGINLYGMTTTELKMCFLVSKEYANQLVCGLHNKFGLGITDSESAPGKEVPHD